ncbi:MAG: hypothetical protein HRJ53_02040 [Acidobacteria bacterium Pan2503]|uniref:Uncharacterized protein n=1 Tax=Candidatus Acidiferrum panamense TaxID=2741543 RepID=A0A7V8NLX3_9BACT|nr:hypothetical protein [Candidatus Acidoferrum panamensis]
MPTTLIYSGRFVFAHNVSGVDPITNDNPGPLIISTVTAYCGAELGGSFTFEDDVDGVMLFYTVPALPSDPNVRNKVWTRLHIVWDAGRTFRIITDPGWDYSVHGYKFST